MMNTDIAALDGTIRVGEYSLSAIPPGEQYGTTGTLYYGDADLISDFIASPLGELEVHGVLHHITMRYDGDLYTLAIDFVGAYSEVHFDHMAARDIVLALGGVQPYEHNPHRR